MFSIIAKCIFQLWKSMFYSGVMIYFFVIIWHFAGTDCFITYFFLINLSTFKSS